MTVKSESSDLYLPPEIWLLIASYASTGDLRRLVQTSSKLQKLLMENKNIWMDAFKREGKYLESYQYFPLSIILNAQKHRMIAPMFLPGCYK